MPVAEGADDKEPIGIAESFGFQEAPAIARKGAVTDPGSEVPWGEPRMAAVIRQGLIGGGGYPGLTAWTVYESARVLHWSWNLGALCWDREISDLPP